MYKYVHTSNAFFGRPFFAHTYILLTKRIRTNVFSGDKLLGITLPGVNPNPNNYFPRDTLYPLPPTPPARKGPILLFCTIDKWTEHHRRTSSHKDPNKCEFKMTRVLLPHSDIHKTKKKVQSSLYLHFCEHRIHLRRYRLYSVIPNGTERALPPRHMYVHIHGVMPYTARHIAHHNQPRTAYTLLPEL